MASSDKHTILVIDDTPDNLRLLERLLSDNDFQARLASSGKLALSSIKKKPPELILLDLNMPEMNGFEVCQHLKDDPLTRDIPVIFLTANINQQDKIKAFDIGGVDYVCKPFESSELLARINAHLKIAELQNHLRQSNLQLEQSLKQLQDAQSELVASKKMEAMGRLTMGLSHELNTPLGVCITSTSLLTDQHGQLEELFKQNNLSSKQLEKYLETSHKALELMHSSSEVANKLLSALRDVSTYEITDSKDWFDFADVLKIINHQYEQELQQKNVDIKLIAEPPCKIYSVRQAWQLVLNHLIENSLQHGFADQSNGQISITVSPVDSGWQIRYQDNGPGLSKEQQATLFDPFCTSSRSSGSLGLGGTIIYNTVIHRIGGEIHLEEPGKHFNITITLPGTIAKECSLKSASL